MKASLIILLIQLGAICYQARCQNYIGMHKNEIRNEMKTSFKQFRLNSETVNPHYKYLKYEDSINEKTMLFFLSEDDSCTMVRMLCDYSNINDMVEELNESFTPVAKDVWKDSIKGKDYTIRLTEEEWFFTVSIKKKE